MKISTTKPYNRDLIIYGTVFGSSVYVLAKEFCGWNVIGFIDDTLPVGTRIIDDCCTLDMDKVFSEKMTCPNVVISLAKPKLKEMILQKLEKYKDRINYPSIISPTAIIAPNASIGRGCIISHYVIVGAGAFIDDYVLVDVRSTVGHGTKIGRYSTVSASSHVSGNIVMGHHSFCGAQSFIMEKRKIGNNVVIGAGSKVFTNVPDGWHMFGYPATKFNV